MSQLQTTSNTGKTVAGLLTSPSFTQELSLALPKHMDAKRVARIMLTDVRKNPSLAACNAQSFFGAMISSAQAGLEIGEIFGQAYLVPFKNEKKKITECQLIIGYRGMIQLAHRSGQVKNIHADVVWDNDFFDYGRGMNQRFEHVPNMQQDGKHITHAYAYAHLMNGGFEYVVLKKKDVDKIKDAAKTQKFWGVHYNEMAKKTALRRLFKLLPVSSEIMQVIARDDAAYKGESFEDVPMISDMGGDDFIDHTEENRSDEILTQGKFADVEAINDER